MSQYDTVFVGFPIWWGREPSVVDTFLDAYDFGGCSFDFYAFLFLFPRLLRPAVEDLPERDFHVVDLDGLCNVGVHAGVNGVSQAESNLRKYERIWKEQKRKHIPEAMTCNLFMLKKILADGGYTGENFANSIKTLSGADVEIVKRNELHTFVVLPKRWIVERSFAWIDKCRRLWKNCERKLQNSFQMFSLAFIRLLLNRY